MDEAFKAFNKAFIATFRTIGYCFVFIVQVMVYLASGKPDKIGDAVGDLGRGITDAIADLFRS
jgi:hypothetical protein